VSPRPPAAQRLPSGCPERSGTVVAVGSLRGNGYEWWLQLAGPFTVSRAGRPQPATQVGTRKARALLALLAVESGRVVTVDRIVDAVWADAPPRRPAENVATLVSRLRSALGAEAIAGGRSWYRLGPACGVDLAEAGRLVRDAEARLAVGESDLALRAASRAVDLLGEAGVLADQPEASWAEPARTRHADLLRRARHAASQAGLRTGEVRQAWAAAEAAVAADPFDETACRLLMQAQVAAGEPAQALAVYERLRATLAEELGVDPAPATQDLHVAILRDGPTGRCCCGRHWLVDKVA
jgi:DNA-binding SARP family transcriptional activator